MYQLYPKPSTYAASNRGAIRPGEYLIIPIENRCSSFHAKLRNSEESVLVTKKLGANYVMSALNLQLDGGTNQVIQTPLENFFFVLEGQIKITTQNNQILLDNGGFGWLPPNTPYEMENNLRSDTRLLWFRKPYQSMNGIDVPEPVFGNEIEIEAIKEVDINPEKQLLPYTNLGFDMAVNLIVCQPGGYYGLVESHAWEHAMYMLDGEGFLILNNQHHHVAKDDFIHIHPFCPEWFCASGMESQPVRFLLYWDCNRDYENEFFTS